MSVVNLPMKELYINDNNWMLIVITKNFIFNVGLISKCSEVNDSFNCSLTGQLNFIWQYRISYTEINVMQYN